MTDLISREAAIEYLMTNMGWHDEDGYEVDDADEKRAIITDLVNGIPAVDAIPVDWLEKKRENLILAAMVHSTVYGDNSIELCHAVNVVLNMWQKEQETRNESKV